MSEFIIETRDTRENINFKDLREEISKRKGKYKRDVLVGFSSVISIELIIEYLSCFEAGGIPAFLSHKSHKVTEANFEKRKKNWENLGIRNLYPEINDPEKIENKFGINFIQLSSGTTSSQKAFGIKRETLYKHLEYYSNKLKLNKDSVIISWLPVYHDMGLITSIFLPLYLGCKSIIIPTFEWIKDYKIFIDLTNKYSATNCWFPNFCFEIFSRKENIAKIESDLSIVNCSERCRKETIDKFMKNYNCKIFSCYAMAENVFAVSQSEDLESFGGILNSGIPDGSTIEISESGEIWISEGTMFDARLESGVFYPPPKKYNTGDIGFLREGKLYVTGRSKEVAKVYGKEVFLPDLEYEVTTNVEVRPGRVVCFSLEGSASEEIVLLYEAFENFDKKIKNIIYQNFEVSSKVYKVPDGFLLKTSSGKILRSEYSNIFKKYKILEEIVYERTRQVINFDTNLISEGVLDSFSIVEVFVLYMEKVYGSPEWTIDFSRLDSVASFLEL